MAESFRFECQKSVEITDPELSEGLEFIELTEEEEEEEEEEDEEVEGKSKKNSSWKSAPIFSNNDDLNPVHITQKYQPKSEPLGHKVMTEKQDGDEKIASAEREESPQKIHSRQDKTLINFLGENEHEANYELIVPPIYSNLIQGGSLVSKVTEIAPDASKDIHNPERSLGSISRLSRIESAKQDMKNFKSATLGRMGKMFKTRPLTPSGQDSINNEIERGAEAAATVEEQYGQDPSRKEKTLSLGRMLRLVDKDGAPRKFFSRSRTGSLTRLRKMNSTAGKVADNSDDSRNIFSRMINQLRDRNQNRATAEPNLQSINGLENSSKPSLGSRLMMSLSARGNSGNGGTTVGGTIVGTSVEYTA